jgi:hypothetical protein
VNVKNLLIPCSAALLLGCSLFDQKVKIETQETQQPRLNLKAPDPVKLNKINWVVISPDNVDEVFSDMKEKKYDVVLFGLSDDDYKNLSMNVIKIRKFIIEQKKILTLYKMYYEPEEEKEVK